MAIEPNHLMMMKILFVCLIVSVQLSAATRRGSRGHRVCKRNVRANAGELTHPVRICDNFTWIFNLDPFTTLQLHISELGRLAEIQIKQMTSESESVIQRREDGEESFESGADSSRVELVVSPHLHQRIRIRYKILSRPNPTDGIGQCHAPSVAVVWRCSGSECRLECNGPLYVPAVQNQTSISCRMPDWRERAESLCITRSSLAELCFDQNGWSIECGYSIDTILRYFQNEDDEAGNEVPDPGDVPATRAPDQGYPRIAEVRGHLARKRRAKFKDYVCRRNKGTGRYRWRCADVERPFIRRCIYWRYVTSFCKEQGLFV